MINMSLMNHNNSNKKLPARLIYKTEQDGFNSYRLFDTKTGDVVGLMLTGKQPNKKYFYIEYLKAFQRNQGVGSYFIKFAEHLSKKAGKEGHLYVNSCRLINESAAPHIFYRKMGFSTKSKLKDLICDLYIKFNYKECKYLSNRLKMFK